jgi:hypothetical protein
LTGVYSDGDNWDCEIDNLNSNYLGGTQTMTLTWLDYEPTNIWTKTDFGFERGKFATTGSNEFNLVGQSIDEKGMIPPSIKPWMGNPNPQTLQL